MASHRCEQAVPPPCGLRTGQAAQVRHGSLAGRSWTSGQYLYICVCVCMGPCAWGCPESRGGRSRCCRSWWAHGSSSPSSWGRHAPQAAIPTPTLLPEPPETDSRGPWRPQLYSHGFLLGSSPCPALVPGVYTASFSLGMLLSQFPPPPPSLSLPSGELWLLISRSHCRRRHPRPAGSGGVLSHGR